MADRLLPKSANWKTSPRVSNQTHITHSDFRLNEGKMKEKSWNPASFSLAVLIERQTVTVELYSLPLWKFFWAIRYCVVWVCARYHTLRRPISSVIHIQTIWRLCYQFRVHIYPFVCCILWAWANAKEEGYNIMFRQRQTESWSLTGRSKQADIKRDCDTSEWLKTWTVRMNVACAAAIAGFSSTTMYIWRFLFYFSYLFYRFI